MPKSLSSSGYAARVRKLADMLTALQDGSQSDFSITRLISLKRLCRTGDVARRFTLTLAELTLARMMATEPPPNDADLALASAAITAMRDYADAPTAEGMKSLRALTSQVCLVQAETVRPMPGKSPVRLIRSTALLLIEDALRCFSAGDDPAQAGEWAYQTARVYGERYHPAHGTGLLAESAPFLADIVRFWVNTRDNEAEG